MDKRKKKAAKSVGTASSRKPSIVIMPSDNEEVSCISTSQPESTSRLQVEEKQIHETNGSPARPKTPKKLLTPHSTSSPSDSEDGTTELTEQTDEALQQLRLPVRPTRDELYTDKDRAATVALGSKDIKVSLLMKKQEEIKRMMPEEKGSSVYYSQGMFGYKRGNVPVAKVLLQKALELQPNSLRCLVARARCHLDAGDIHGALEDAEGALKMDSQCAQALLVKADALYQKGHFEHALLQYHWGHRMRPGMTSFRLGIWKSEEAIHNSVSQDSNRKCKGDRGTKIKIPKQKTAKLLQELNHDKVYVSQLLRNKALKNARKDSTGNQVRHLAKETLEYLQSRQNFWHQQDPFAARRQRSAPARLKTRTKTSLQLSTDRLSDEMSKRVDTLEKEAAINKEDYLGKCFQMLDTLESFTESKLSNKSELLASVYSLLGNAHLEEKDFDSAIFYHEMDWEIGENKNLAESKSRSLDNLGRSYAMSKQYEKAIEMWERKLLLTTKILEETWLHHEIGRCYLEIGNYQKAKVHGRKCRALAESDNRTLWRLNAAVLIAQAEVSANNVDEGLAAFEEAFEIAQSQKDRSVRSAILTAMKKLKNEQRDMKLLENRSQAE